MARTTLFAAAKLQDPPPGAARLITDVDYRAVLTHAEDLDGAGITFVNCKFDYCVLERAYFRRAIFRNCSFIGTRLIDCNLRRAQMENCRVDYVSLRGTYVEWDVIVKNSPSSLGIRQLFYRELRNNATSLGELRPVNAFITNEMDCHRNYQHTAWSYSLPSTWDNLTHEERTHFKEEFPTLSNRMGAFIRWLTVSASSFAWGYGESLFRLSRTTMLVLAGFALWLVFGNAPAPSDLVTASKVVGLAFLDLGLPGDAHKATIEKNALLFSALVSWRYIALGLWLSIAYRRWTFR